MSRSTSASTGVVAEEVEGAEAIYSRTLHLLVVEDGQIAEHIMYCTGPWDTSTVARHKAEAPIICWLPRPHRGDQAAQGVWAPVPRSALICP
jgi:hypothetical protein